MNQTLAGWLSYIEMQHPVWMDLSLERIREVAERLEVTAFDCPVITITGTNGKGSTAHCLKVLARQHALRVGVFTSPHLLHFNERISVNSTFITDEMLVELFHLIEKARGDITLTYFEWSTLAALLYFKQQNIDLMVLEVGLGGRLDAVNIIDADCSILTNVALDHTEYLGDTQEAIGREKLGITRQGKHLINGERALPQALVAELAQKKVNVISIGEGFSYHTEENGLSLFRLGHYEVHLPRLMLPLHSCACALAAWLTLFPNLCEERRIQAALSHAQLLGRFTVLQNNPSIVIDVAHNPHAALYLASELKQRRVSGKTYALIAMMCDKDQTGFVSALSNVVDQFYFASFQSKRGSDIEKMVHFAQKSCITFEAFNAIPEAFQTVIHALTPNDRLICTGSFVTAGAAFHLWKEGIT